MYPPSPSGNTKSLRYLLYPVFVSSQISNVALFFGSVLSVTSTDWKTDSDFMNLSRNSCFGLMCMPRRLGSTMYLIFFSCPT